MSKGGAYREMLGKKEATINSKVKGNKGELMAAKVLSKWTKARFNRTPGSGGLNWIEDSRVSGDVVAPKDFYFPFSVEVKFLKSIPLPEKVNEELRSNSVIYTLWSQSKRDAKKVDRFPVLMFRRNGDPKGHFYMCFSEDISRILIDYSGATDLYIGTEKFGGNPMLRIFSSTDLLKSVDFSKFVKQI